MLNERTIYLLALLGIVLGALVLAIVAFYIYDRIMERRLPREMHYSIEEERWIYASKRRRQ